MINIHDLIIMKTLINFFFAYIAVAILLSFLLQSINAGITAAFLLSCYMFPGYLSGSRGHPNQDSICTLNLLLGWTIIGWIIALIWAVSDFDESRKKDTFI